jgi:hypothetical protein
MQGGEISSTASNVNVAGSRGKGEASFEAYAMDDHQGPDNIKWTFPWRVYFVINLERDFVCRIACVIENGNRRLVISGEKKNLNYMA